LRKGSPPERDNLTKIPFFAQTAPPPTEIIDDLTVSKVVAVIDGGSPRSNKVAISSKKIKNNNKIQKMKKKKARKG
jgi:hypothetical protein